MQSAASKAVTSSIAHSSLPLQKLCDHDKSDYAGAIWELHESAAKAQGQRANCQLLDSFMQDVMRTLDNQGRSLQSSDPLQLANMLELVEAAIDMVDMCNKPGMLFCAHGHWQRSV